MAPSVRPHPGEVCTQRRHFCAEGISVECGCSQASNVAESARPTFLPRVRVVAAAVVIFGGLAAAYVAAAAPTRTGPRPARVHIERDGMRYEYNAILGVESLTVTGAPGAPRRDVLAERPDAAERLRRALAAELGVDSLDELRADHEDEIASMRALGYL